MWYLGVIIVLFVWTVCTTPTPCTLLSSAVDTDKASPKQAQVLANNLLSPRQHARLRRGLSSVSSTTHINPSHAVVLSPPSSFLQQIIADSSFRLVIIAGNNTASATCEESVFVKLLRQWLEKSKGFNMQSYVRISPSNANTSQIQDRFHQDISRDVLGLTSKDTPKTWPNVLMFEHGQDCWEEDKLLCVFALERLIQHIFDLYEAQHLLHPDVMFVDVMRVERYYHLGKSWNTRQYPQHLLACNGSTLQKEKERDASSRAKAFVVPEQAVYNDRGSSFGAAMVEYARFYRYVVLSTSDAWYPSFVHHFLSHDLCETWPLFAEGHRLTLQGHEALFSLVRHLFDSVLEQHQGGASHPHSHHISMKQLAHVFANTTNTTSHLSFLTHSNNIYNADVRFAPMASQIYPISTRQSLINSTVLLDETYYFPTHEELTRAFFGTQLLNQPTGIASSQLGGAVSGGFGASGGASSTGEGSSSSNSGRGGRGSGFWAENILHSKSLRILLLGGSNTANALYVQRLQQSLLQDHSLGYDWLNHSSSYIINGGVSGRGAIIISLPFETSLSPLQWPNVIMMEYSVNCYEQWTCIYAIERVIRHYRKLYHKHNVPSPSFVFLELFRNGYYDVKNIWIQYLKYEHLATCNSQHIYSKHHPNATEYFQLPDNDHYNHRGSFFSMHLAEYARYYSYPILSWTDALFPSFVRFMDSHETCAAWPMTNDGVHMNLWGAEIMVTTIVSFLQQQIDRVLQHEQHTHQHNNQHLPQHQIFHRKEELPPMFTLPHDMNTDLLIDYREWGMNIPFEERFMFIVHQNQGFEETSLRNHNDGKHQCYGAKKSDAKIIFKISIPGHFTQSIPQEIRSNLTYQLVIGYLHSWDKMYVGDMQCRLFTSKRIPDPKDSKKLILEKDKQVAEVLITGNSYQKQAVPDSTPRMIVITKEMFIQEYLLECQPMQNDRLACITNIAIYSQE